MDPHVVSTDAKRCWAALSLADGHLTSSSAPGLSFPGHLSTLQRTTLPKPSPFLITAEPSAQTPTGKEEDNSGRRFNVTQTLPTHHPILHQADL